jgi:ribosome maturation factor RimP
MSLAERIERLIQPTVEAMGFEVVRVLLMGRGHARLQVMAERPDGRPITIDECALISRAISTVLDVEDPIEGAYTLEVSSPGIERPLVKERDYDRFRGREASIELARPMDGRRRFRGRLVGREGGRVSIEVDGIAREVPLGDIARAHLVTRDLRATKAEGKGRP